MNVHPASTESEVTAKAKDSGIRTPGPWTVREVGITEYPSNCFNTVCEIRGSDGTGVADHILLDDARRIVACVNAFTGVPIEAIESGEAVVIQRTE